MALDFDTYRRFIYDMEAFRGHARCLEPGKRMLSVLSVYVLGSYT